jgi:hypothetical protein
VLFPLYVTVLWINLGITILAFTVYTTAAGEAVLPHMVLTNLLVQFGIVTLVFFLLNRSQQAPMGPPSLVERYLRAVRQYLPRGQREDIIKELSEHFLEQIEERQTELGRPVTVAEVEAILKQHGHPLIVAGRYLGDSRSLALGRQLIGPALFPFYLKALIWVFVLTVAAGAAVLVKWPQVLSSVLVHVVLNLVAGFGVVTLVFALIEIYHRKAFDNWLLFDEHARGAGRNLPGNEANG